MCDEQERLGKDGRFAEVGDIVEIVKGRKFPLGMKVVVADHEAFCKYQSLYTTFHAYGDDHVVFYDEGFKKERINSKNVEIVAVHEDRDWNPEYRHVHTVEVRA